MSDVLSHYAVVKIRDWGSYYHFLHENLNAAEWLIFWLKAIKGTSALRGIRGGMSRLIYAMLNELCKLQPNGKAETGTGCSAKEQQDFFKRVLAADDNPLIKVRTKLTELELLDTGNIKLKVGEDEAITAKRVILALPKLPLDKLKMPLPEVLKKSNVADVEKCKKALAAVQCLPLLKCFFIIEHPWWKEDLGLNATAADVPTREISYTLSEDKTRGMIMIYTDHPAITCWSDYLRDFQQAADPDQFHYNVWWRDRIALPSGPKEFDCVEEWKGAGQDIVLMWKKETNRSSSNQEEWKQIQTWWAEMPLEVQMHRLKKYYKRKKLIPAWTYLVHKVKQRERLWNRFVQFARDYEHHSVSRHHLLACGMHDWGKEPFGAAAHGWLPGEQSCKHIEYLSAFPRHGVKENGKWKNKIHVVGEAYSDYQGFIEGSLRSAEFALARIRQDLDVQAQGASKGAKKKSKTKRAKQR